MAIDVFGREVKVGDYIAAATMSYKSAHLRVGKVISFGQKTGLPSIRFAHNFRTNSKDQSVHVDLSRAVGTFVLVDKATLPKIVVDAIELGDHDDN